METEKLIFSYLKTKLDEKYIKKPKVDNFNLNGNIIKINYSYNPEMIGKYEYWNDDTIEVELLDYITFLYTLKL